MQIEIPPTEKACDKTGGERCAIVSVNAGDGRARSGAAFGLAVP